MDWGRPIRTIRPQCRRIARGPADRIRASAVPVVTTAAASARQPMFTLVPMLSDGPAARRRRPGSPAAPSALPSLDLATVSDARRLCKGCRERAGTRRPAPRPGHERRHGPQYASQGPDRNASPDRVHRWRTLPGGVCRTVDLSRTDERLRAPPRAASRARRCRRSASARCRCRCRSGWARRRRPRPRSSGAGSGWPA